MVEGVTHQQFCYKQGRKKLTFMVVRKYLNILKKTVLKGLIASAGRGRQIQPNFTNTVIF